MHLSLLSCYPSLYLYLYPVTQRVGLTLLLLPSRWPAQWRYSNKKKMSVYYRLFWQDIQFKSIEMKEKERERERRNGFRVMAATAARLCQTHTHKSQSILIHIVQQAPLSSRAVITFFFSLALSLFLSRSNSSSSSSSSNSRSVVFTIKFILVCLYRPVFSLTYLHHLYVNRPFLIRCHTRLSSRYFFSSSTRSFFLSHSLSLSFFVRELI